MNTDSLVLGCGFSWLIAIDKLRTNVPIELNFKEIAALIQGASRRDLIQNENQYSRIQTPEFRTEENLKERTKWNKWIFSMVKCIKFNLLTLNGNTMAGKQREKRAFLPFIFLLKMQTAAQTDDNRAHSATKKYALPIAIFSNEYHIVRNAQLLAIVLFWWILWIYYYVCW